MSRPELFRPAPRPLYRRQANGPLWLVLGISFTGLSFAHATIAADTLPQGGTYVAGSGAIASQGNGLVITQPGSTRGVIEWNSFSIGRNNSVAFDNGSGATLNRVTGGSPSAILGRLSATGSLYVINPQGIVVGASGVVTTGGRFVASTLDICDDAFMKGGGALTLSGNSGASVINLGRISSSGGDVFLIARDAVINDGTVSAPNGTAELAAGGQVLLQDSGSSRQVFVQSGNHGTVLNRGHIKAAQVSLQAADGNIYALAGGGTRIRATGTASRDGHVWLVADGGRVEQFGRITASNADGNGGTVDTQAAHLAFGRGAAVHAGQWNISTPSITVGALPADALERSLDAGTSVALTTSGENGATGDLVLATDLTWRGDADLTLAAYRHVSIAPNVTVRNIGAGDMTLRADVSGIDNGGSVRNGGTVDWSKSTGIVSVLYDMNASATLGTMRGNTAWTAPFDSGLVDQITAYRLLNTRSDIVNIAADLSGNYALGRDVDVTNPGAQPNVLVGDLPTPFNGQFDGMGRSISNLSVSATSNLSDYSPHAVGLFGVIGPTAVVRNVTVNGSAGGSASLLSASIGILAAINHGTIANAHSSGSAGTFDGPSAGGLVGSNDGLITRSSSSASVGHSGGGLVNGNGETGVIRQSFATGAVNGVIHVSYAGGLVNVNSGTITQSYATGPVTYNPNYCGHYGGNVCREGPGALVGWNLDTGKITQSFATGTITQDLGPTGGQLPAGIANNNEGSIGRDVYWDRQTTGATVGAAQGNAVPAAQGLTTAQMNSTASFGPTWDFGANGVWAMPAGATHPVLRWQLAQ
ncbi:filamentous hemagglutinin N-terminal domain-containing protein [Paraburkholderia strydomiana]|uniref:two-partner secretion domain-containing protein n=1 Tax=Paraburkholderia strydomiana TaxID=1245417 RepID=UPI0038B703BA